MEDYETVEFTEDQVREALKDNYKEAEDNGKSGRLYKQGFRS